MNDPSLEHISENLSRSQILQDYERAFSEATGLPLKYHAAGKKRPAVRGASHTNPFCEQMAETEPGCRMCVETQEKITEGGRSTRTRTESCPAGLTDSAVPVQLGEKVLGYLQTGQVSLRQLTSRDFERVARWLRKGGADLDFEALEKSFLATRVITRQQHEAVLRLLEVFAQHLSLSAERIATQQAHSEPPVVQRARQFIEAHQSENLDLAAVARAVNVSTFHFCKMFKRATGLTFTEHLSLVRVARAKQLLANPQLRISEVAFEVGFSSLTHFNRMFRRIAGQSPTAFRAQILANGRKTPAGA